MAGNQPVLNTFEKEMEDAVSSVEVKIGDELIGVGWYGEDGVPYLGAPHTGKIARLATWAHVNGALRIYARHFEKTGTHGI